MTRSKKIAALIALGVVVTALATYDGGRLLTSGHGRVVDGLIAKNIAARGGADNWRAVESLRLSGQLDLGQGMHVPYVMEQMRPDRMCFEFEFDDQWATQCVEGGEGWKRLPFRGKPSAEPMSEAELREAGDMASIDGLLFDSVRRGHDIDYVGTAQVDGRNAAMLEVRLPNGAMRWVYLDEETGLELKVESKRILRGRERRVETYFSDWRETNGILIAHRQDTNTAGEWESHFLTVDSVEVNPPMSPDRFELPADSAGPGLGQ